MIKVKIQKFVFAGKLGMTFKPNFRMVKVAVDCYSCRNVFAKLETVFHDGNCYCAECFEEDFVECSDCGDFAEKDDCTYVCDHGYVCESCADDYFYCEDCNEYCHNDNAVRIPSRRGHDTYVCEHCVDNGNYYRCDSCHDTFHSDSMLHGENISVCDYNGNGCSNDYYRCEDCGDLVHADNVCSTDDSCYCQYCYDSNGHGESDLGIVHPYGYKPDPIFKQLSSEYNVARYFGLELEIDGAGESHENARELLGLLDSEDESVAYFKHDGSLSRGMELVTHPMTYDFFDANYDQFIDFTLRAKDMGYRSHNTTTCGLHLHISKKAFGADANEIAHNISKLLVLFENNYASFLKFSRRTESSMDLWAMRYGMDSDETVSELFNKASRGGRYRAINLQNSKTVELRFFKGTLNPNTIKATLQLANGMMDVILEKSLEYIIGLDFVSMVELIMASHEDYTELAEYLVERGITE